jgi:hypothetical protein
MDVFCYMINCLQHEFSSLLIWRSALSLTVTSTADMKAALGAIIPKALAWCLGRGAMGESGILAYCF